LNNFKETILYGGVILLKYISFLFLIPPIQSVPESELRLFPLAIFGVVVFLTASLLQNRYLKKSLYISIIDSIMFLVLGFLILQRVKSGIM